MGVFRYYATLLVLSSYVLPFVVGQAELCAYMTAIPREDRPEDFPTVDATGLNWSQRPLIPADHHEDLCMDIYVPTSATSGTQIIYMEEEISVERTIAVLNYNGNEEPYIGQFLQGTRNILGPEIRRVGDLWHLIITQRQDYEIPTMRNYMFNVRVDGEALVATVSLQVVNIDDNPPRIEIFDTCQVPELGEPRPTNCRYDVFDADGYISTGFMSFQLNSDRGDEQVFTITQAPVPDDEYTVVITIELERALNFEENALHIFSVTAFDSYPNNHTVTMMVQVENVEHRPPRWVEIFAVQQFNEKTNQSFNIRAIDGDTGLNRAIYYRLETDPEDDFFSVELIGDGHEGAIFHVSSIDRDELQRELFQLTIIAYKNHTEVFETRASVVIIVDDVNDQTPEPLHDEYNVRIMEETALTLNFEQEFGFNDIDLGQNAQYTVHLESVFPPGAEAAFYIAPQVGYQRQTFIMGTLNHSMLDYEVLEFQNIQLRVVAIDMDNNNFVGVATLNIDLINWNDEDPIFDQQVYSASFKETEGEGFLVTRALATDRDIGDRVVHSLMGNAADYLTIDSETGDIYVTANDSFDYHRQNELFVQIRADDTLGEPFRTTTSQLVIELEDVNNTPPTLRLPRGSPRVEENVEEDYLITEEITATDPDTTAELLFEIDWTSSYATKQGRETPPIEYHNCVSIETVYPDENRKGSAIGKVVVKEIRDNVTIDFEEFEVLYLTVRVTDLNTTLGVTFDELTFTIIIEDMNDNAPIWSAGTLTQSFRVREGSDSGTVIGSILATDIDGPLYNQVRYTIRPREDTPDQLVRVDFVTGQLEVDLSNAIDADLPKRDNLYYTVIASDKCHYENETECPPDETFWEPEGNITIHIIDTNNKFPIDRKDLYLSEIRILENATDGHHVVFLQSEDLDRDEIYHSVSYQINYLVNPRIRDFFTVNQSTGEITVELSANEPLDRDGDEPQHRIYLTFIDNFLSEGDGNRNSIESEVLVILLDVNDNAPELPAANSLSWSISENLQQGEQLQPIIYARDRDEPNTENSRVSYDILNLNLTDREVTIPRLFEVITVRTLNEENIANYTGVLETREDLQGYWGTYEIHIQAYDHGDPPLDSDEIYQLVVRPYNFNAPQFVFPPPDGSESVRLAKERAVANGPLAMVGGDLLTRISATDPDGLHAGLVTFEVSGDDDAANYFQVVNDGENLGSLILTQVFPEDTREFTVTIRATDGGINPDGGPLSSETTLKVVFVPTVGEPVFIQSTAELAFYEGETGLTERFPLPEATDHKNYGCESDCLPIYYTIVDGNQAGHFALDNNVVYLQSQLDREDATSYTLTVVASNSQQPTAVLPASTLTVTIAVREENPRPIFITNLYTAGISTLDTINKELLTVQATHSEGAAITYSIDTSSMQVDSSLQGVRDSAFELHPLSGVLTLTMQPTASMQGMFEFNAIAADSTGANDTAEVKIYLISSQNRVFFLFINDLETLERQRDFVAQTFTAGFGMQCNIDQVVPASDSNGVALTDTTEVRAHFIENDIPVPASVIEQLRSDTQLLRSVQTTLNTELLVLMDFVTGDSPTIGTDSVQITVYVLAALSGVLAFMCLVLLISFVIRTRALNRRLEALSMTKYGSVDSGLNRAGIAAPGTNKHAVEGSNPIWNESLKAPDFDAISDISNESDLIGVEDLPQFRNDYFPPENVNIPHINEPSQGISHHSNNFGFNTTPFSPEFTNNNFRN